MTPVADAEPTIRRAERLEDAARPSVERLCGGGARVEEAAEAENEHADDDPAPVDARRRSRSSSSGE